MTPRRRVENAVRRAAGGLVVTGASSPLERGDALAAERAATKALEESLRALEGRRLRRAGPAEAAAVRAAFAPALPALRSRFGQLADSTRGERTEPEDEHLYHAAAACLESLAAHDLLGDLFEEVAATALLAYDLSDRRAAVRWANTAGQLNPGERNNKLNAAVLASEFFRFDLALRLAGEVLLEAPDDAFAWRAKAQALEGNKRALEHAAGQTERDGDAKRAAAMRKEAEENGRDAVSALREVVKIDPGDARAWYDLGKALYTRSELRDAGAAYARSVELDPDNALAWYQKASVHEALEQPDEAVDALRRAMALDKRDPSNQHFRIAAMVALKGDPDGAFEWIASGLSHGPANFYGELYRIEFAALYGDPRWTDIVKRLFADEGFQQTRAAQAEVGFSWGLFDYGSVLFFDSLADAFGAAETYRREGETERAREFYARLVELLEREGHARKAALVRERLASLGPAGGPTHADGTTTN